MSARDALAFLLDRASFITASEANPRHDAPLRISAAKRNDRAIVGKCSVEPWKRIGHRRNRHFREDWFPGDSAVALRSLAGGSRECLPLPPMRRVAIVLTHRVNGPGVEYYCNDSKKLRYGQSSLCKIRNERNFRARRPKTAQVAVNRAWHDA